MAKKIHVRPSKGQSKLAFIVGIVFCFIGVFGVIPMAGLFGVLWTAVAAYGTYVNFRNGFTDRQIDSHVIEIDENGEDITVTKHTGFSSYAYDAKESKPRQDDAAERLRKLADLYAQSLITREEYEQKKKEILDEL